MKITWPCGCSLTAGVMRIRPLEMRSPLGEAWPPSTTHSAWLRCADMLSRTKPALPVHLVWDHNNRSLVPVEDHSRETGLGEDHFPSAELFGGPQASTFVASVKQLSTLHVAHSHCAGETRPRGGRRPQRDEGLNTLQRVESTPPPSILTLLRPKINVPPSRGWTNSMSGEGGGQWKWGAGGRGGSLGVPPSLGWFLWWYFGSGGCGCQSEPHDRRNSDAALCNVPRRRSHPDSSRTPTSLKHSNSQSQISCMSNIFW